MSKALLFAFTLFSYILAQEPDLQEAELLYNSAKLEKDWQKKQKKTNEALAIYGELAEKYQPDFGDGKLYYNLANSFYELGEYPFALYYYNKAILLRPNDKQVLGNLQTVQEQIGQNKEKDTGSFSLPLALQLFTLFCILFFTFWSLFIWLPSQFAKYAAFASLFAALICLGGIFYSRYLSPIEAVAVHASFLYKGPGEQYGKASNQVLFSGSKVQVLSLAQEGKWLKVLSENNGLGYVPSEAVKLLD